MSPYSFDFMTRPSSRSGSGKSSGARPEELEVPPLVSVERAATPLVDRARTFLEAGPAGSVPLIEHVCSLPGAPPVVAEQMALALFADVPDVRRDEAGRWSLGRERPAKAWPTRSGACRIRQVAASPSPWIPLGVFTRTTDSFGPVFVNDGSL